MRRCLRCGAVDNLTRDHVASRVQLRLALGQDEYARFCSKVRKLNIQRLCTQCNNDKGDKSCDLRSKEIRDRLLEAIDEFGIADKIDWSDPEDTFSRPQFVLEE